MDEEFHMGPSLQDILLAGVFQYTVEHDEVPRRDARERTHVLPGGLFRDEPHLFVEVRYQRRLLVGNAEDVGDGRRILSQDGRQVARHHVVPFTFDAFGTAQRQHLPVHYAGCGVEMAVERHDVFRSPHVGFAHSGQGNGDVFAFRTRRSGGFGEPFGLFRPQGVPFAAARAVDELADGFIVVNGYPVAELLLRGNALHAEVASELGLRAVGEQVAELAFLYLGRVLAEVVDFAETVGEIKVDEFCYCGHVRYGLEFGRRFGWRVPLSVEIFAYFGYRPRQRARLPRGRRR